MLWKMDSGELRLLPLTILLLNQSSVKALALGLDAEGMERAVAQMILPKKEHQMEKQKLAEKKRLDALLFSLGLTESQEKSTPLIMAGSVYVDHQSRISQEQWLDRMPPSRSEEALPYVSRGGKAEKGDTGFPVTLLERFVWILALLPAALRIVCCKMGRKKGICC